MPETQGSYVEWRGPQVTALIDELLPEMLYDVAERAAVHAAEIVEGEDLRDTHFMRNAFYEATEERSSYDRLIPDGLYRSHRTGRPVERRKAPEQRPREGQALVANAAPYFIWLELRYRIIARAIQAAADEVGGIVREEARRAGL